MGMSLNFVPRLSRSRGVWHRNNVIEPAYFIHVTPGPRGEARPL